MRRRGFTLLELLVVLVLSGLLAVATSFAWRSVAGAAQVESSLESIEFFDRQLRIHAARFHRRQRVVFDVDGDRIQAILDEGRAPPLRELRLGHVQIRGVRAAVNGTFRDVNTIDVSSHGQTTTYVVEIQSSGNRRDWLLFCGVTGEAFRLKHEGDVDHVRQLLAPSRPDAS